MTQWVAKTLVIAPITRIKVLIYKKSQYNTKLELLHIVASAPKNIVFFFAYVDPKKYTFKAKIYTSHFYSDVTLTLPNNGGR